MTYFSVQAHSVGKRPERNEDYYGWNEHRIVLSDGATDRSGVRYEVDEATGAYKTGGEIASRLAVQAALASPLHGDPLVHAVTRRVQGYYRTHCPEALTDTAARFSASLLVVTLLLAQQAVEVLQVADSPFRINGTTIYDNPMLIDEHNIALRAATYNKTGDIRAADTAIAPALAAQHRLQNNANDSLGYGVIDGGLVPEQFIKSYQFPLSEVHTIELASDGYYGHFPKDASIEAYEAMISEIHTDDPYKVGRYPAIKPTDDRTVLIIKFKP